MLELPVARVRRVGAVGLEGGDLGDVGVRALGGRQDVAEAAEVVVLVRARGGGCARGARRDGEQRAVATGQRCQGAWNPPRD